MTMVSCKGCGKDIHETAYSCPQCGAPQAETNKISNDAKLMLLVESRKKSGWVAAILNLFIAGTGYMYCERVILGVVALIFSIAAAWASDGISFFLITPILVADGFLAANRYNKQLMIELIGQTA